MHRGCGVPRLLEPPHDFALATVSAVRVCVSVGHHCGSYERAAQQGFVPAMYHLARYSSNNKPLLFCCTPILPPSSSSSQCSDAAGRACVHVCVRTRARACGVGCRVSGGGGGVVALAGEGGGGSVLRMAQVLRHGDWRGGRRTDAHRLAYAGAFSPAQLPSAAYATITTCDRQLGARCVG